MNVAPTAEGERIKSLDVIRGFAVLGIPPVNAIYFAAPWQAGLNPALAPLAVSPETYLAWAAMHVLFEFKCITLFSLLFGASIHLIGGEVGDTVRGGVLTRRLLWLGVFGLIHGALIWSGDVLLTYAVTGLAAMQARSWSVRMQLTMGIGLVLAWLALQHSFAAWIATAAPENVAAIVEIGWRPSDAELTRVTGVYRGALPGVIAENFATWANFVANGLLTFMLRTAGLMMIGMALMRLGFFSARASLAVYAAFILVGLAAFAALAWQARLNYQAGFDFVFMHRFGNLPNDWLSPFGASFYASVFALMVRLNLLTRATSALAAVGRMAFTNYLTQSLIMTTIFWGGRGFGLFGELSRTELWGVVAAIWALQLLWSTFWLRAFRMGPFEWLWRRLSYNSPLPLRREPSIA